ncbi:hypothetical protein [Moritella viscosa]|uniref:hypothetical protein n=1 Tax=Moritella viscosa TaxID=80854 RepID=UPI0009103E50|nr:hypothetical protein [Moritella viscosa]SGZ03602.1 NTP pyrophosphohydrolase [Moritella viscosa]
MFKDFFAAQWIEEEKSTIQKWKWWSLEEMCASGHDSFKPEWIPALLNEIIENKVAVWQVSEFIYNIHGCVRGNHFN